MVFISSDHRVGHATLTLDPSFSWLPQVCRGSLEAGRFASRPHWHPLSAKRRSVTQPANRSIDWAKIHQPSSVLFVCQTAIKSHYGLLFSDAPILILSYLFKLWSFPLIACFLADWRLTALPGLILLQKLGAGQCFLPIHTCLHYCFCSAAVLQK